MIDKAELDNLRALEQAATPGPWKFKHTSYAPEITSDTRHIAKALYHMGSEDNQVIPNAELIAAARNALPNMLDEIDRLKSENTRLDEWLEFIWAIGCDYDGYDPQNTDQMRGLVDEFVDMAVKARRGDKPYITAKALDESVEKLTSDERERKRLIDENARLTAEVERVTRERDAAVYDTSGYCETCAFSEDCAKHDNNDAAPPTWYYGDCEDWHWRGVKEDKPNE